MTDPAKERELDRKAERVVKTTRAINVDRAILIAFMSLVLLAQSVQYLAIRDITSSTNEAVTKTIPNLERQVARLEEQVKDAEYILTMQAVPAIVSMAQQLREAGIDPPEVLLNPDSPPFKASP